MGTDSRLRFYGSIEKLVTGGQSGVDRACLDVALSLGIPCGGWCPQGRLAEDGVLPERYPLIETESSDPRQRTEFNVRDSDATLVLWDGRGTDGTRLTIECAHRYNRPLLCTSPSQFDRKNFEDWIQKIKPRVLNIAGPRESIHPGVYQETYTLLMALFSDGVGGQSHHKGSR